MTKILQPVNATKMGPNYPAPCLSYLDLHLQMLFEVREECQEDCKRQLKDIGDGGDTVLRERNAQVLLDSVDEHLVGAEDGACILQY